MTTKFKFSAQVTVSAHTVVEAKTEAEARFIAESRGIVLSGSWGGNESSEQWTIEDADGEPENIRCEGEGDDD